MTEIKKNAMISFLGTCLCAYSACMKPQVQFFAVHKPGIVLHSFDPSIPEIEAEGQTSLEQPGPNKTVSHKTKQNQKQKKNKKQDQSTILCHQIKHQIK